MTMIRENWPTLLLPGLRKTFHERLRDRSELFKREEVFGPGQGSRKAQESHQGIGEMGSDGFNQFQRNRRVPYDDFDPGFKTDLVHRSFAKGMIVERELMEDNQYPDAGIPREVTEEVEKLGNAAAIHREKSAANLFRNAFTDSGVDDEGHPIAGADGVGLCSEAHPLSPSNASTQSNEGTLSFGRDNVKTTALAMREFTDDRGELVSIKPDLLLVPPELGDAARILVGTTNEPGSDHNDINTLKGRYTVVEWDYLTDSNAWFMIDSGLKGDHLVWYDRVLPEFDTEGDFDAIQAKYRAFYRFSRGYDAWQWIFGQNPS